MFDTCTRFLTLKTQLEIFDTFPYSGIIEHHEFSSLEKMDDWLSGYIDHSHQADQTTLDSKHIDHSRPRLRLRLGNRNRFELRTWTPTTLLEATFW